MRGCLSFEHFLEIDLNDPDFGVAPYVKDFKERQNISKSRLDENSDCAYLNVGDIKTLDYDQRLGQRYLACMDMSYDTALAIYDVNNRRLTVHRFYDFAQDKAGVLTKMLYSKDGTRNLEARLVGMQNDQYFKPLIAAFLFVKANALPISEIDLFGRDVRHVAFDVKTGLAFDVLANNKPYKAGELKNTLTVEQFERSTKQQVQAPTAAAPLK